MGLLDAVEDIKKEEKDYNKLFLGILILIGSPVVLAFLIVKKAIKNDGFLVKFHDKKRRLLILLEAFFTSIVISGLIYYFTKDVGLLYKVFYFIPIFYTFLAIFFLFSEELFTKDINFELKSKYLKNKFEDFFNVEKSLLDPSNAPIGISLTTKSVSSLEINRRHEHLIITGGSGLGKTSLALSLLRHDFVWNRPAIFIDPKGDREDVNTIIHYAKLYNRENDLYIFSLAESNDYFYDPLALGKAESKVDKLIQTLTFENDYYRSVAENILSIIFSIYEYRNERMTLNILEGLLLSKDRLNALLDTSANLILKMSNDAEKQSLIDKIDRFKSIKNEEIMGLQSKISRLNNKELKNKINPDPKKHEISVINAIENNKILVFDIKAGEYSSLAKLLGRIIIKDLEIAASYLQDKKLKINCDFVPIYFDEFDSFATETFHEFIKTARSGKLGLTLMFQSVAGIQQINEFLTHQATTNSVTSIHFRSNSEIDLNYVANLCGTETRKGNSNQIDQNNILKKLTGKGTEFLTENFRVSPNLIRELSYGQCIVYKKGINQIDLVQSWHGKKELKNSMPILDLKKSVNSSINFQNNKIIPKNKIKVSRADARLLAMDPVKRYSILRWSESEKIRDLQIALTKRKSF